VLFKDEYEKYIKGALTTEKGCIILFIRYNTDPSTSISTDFLLIILFTFNNILHGTWSEVYST